MLGVLNGSRHSWAVGWQIARGLAHGDEFTPTLRHANDPMPRIGGWLQSQVRSLRSRDVHEFVHGTLRNKPAKPETIRVM